MSRKNGRWLIQKGFLFLERFGHDQILTFCEKLGPFEARNYFLTIFLNVSASFFSGELQKDIRHIK